MHLSQIFFADLKQWFTFLILHSFKVDTFVSLLDFAAFISEKVSFAFDVFDLDSLKVGQLGGVGL